MIKARSPEEAKYLSAIRQEQKSRLAYLKRDKEYLVNKILKGTATQTEINRYYNDDDLIQKLISA